MTPLLFTGGCSEVAQFVGRCAYEERGRLSSSHALGIAAEVRDGLGDVAWECRLPNWDGFGAAAVSRETLERAHRFLDSLPPGFSPTSVGAEPDGHVTLEWHRSARRTFSVSVTADGELHYAGLFGPNRSYGSERFIDAVPEIILTMIRRVLAA